MAVSSGRLDVGAAARTEPGARNDGDHASDGASGPAGERRSRLLPRVRTEVRDARRR